MEKFLVGGGTLLQIAMNLLRNYELHCKGEPYRFSGLRDPKVHRQTDKDPDTFI